MQRTTSKKSSNTLSACAGRSYSTEKEAPPRFSLCTLGNAPKCSSATSLLCPAPFCEHGGNISQQSPLASRCQFLLTSLSSHQEVFALGCEAAVQKAHTPLTLRALQPALLQSTQGMRSSKQVSCCLLVRAKWRQLAKQMSHLHMAGFSFLW